MRIAPLADVKSKLSAYLDECKTDGPVVITRNGKPAAVLVYPVDDEDLENIVFSRSPRLQNLLEKSRQSIREGKGLTEQEFWQVVDEKVAEKA